MSKIIRIVLGVILVMIFVTPVFANDFTEWLNAENYLKNIEKVKAVQLNAGIGYSIIDKEFKAIYTKKWAYYKAVAINYGYSIDNMLIGSLTYNILSLKDDFGITIPVLDLVSIDLGLYGGWKRLQIINGTQGNNEWDFGGEATLIHKTF